jgi:hypothetical protein
MTEWYEKPYAGGPMAVAAKYFPRPLYPPDALDNGKVPSPPGGDVLAVKRTLSRLGRWMPWSPSTWDNTYSNAVSHGRGPNVGDSGVAGFQRQMNLDPTGFLGQKTFNALASARVPAHLPHANEMGMDANAVNLIMEAYYQFNTPPAPAPLLQRVQVLTVAKEYIGYKESPAGSNHTKFGAWYGMDYQPWCAMFIAYLYEVECGGSPSFAQAQRYAYVPYITGDARNHKNGLSIVTQPEPGDLVCFDWGHDGVPDHIGIFESGSPTRFNAIEGNTSTSNNSNGGEVMRRARDTGQAAITFVRVQEP